MIDEHEIFDWGYAEDEVCNRHGCKGIIEKDSGRSCLCHTGVAPCSSCVDGRNFCPECLWAEWQCEYGTSDLTKEEIETQLLDNIDF